MVESRTLKTKPITSSLYVIRIKKDKLYSVEEIHEKNTINYPLGNARYDNMIKKAFYVLAKTDVEQFKELHDSLRRGDPKYFTIAEQVLLSIQLEYNFD